MSARVLVSATDACAGAIGDRLASAPFAVTTVVASPEDWVARTVEAALEADGAPPHAVVLAHDWSSTVGDRAMSEACGTAAVLVLDAIEARTGGWPRHLVQIDRGTSGSAGEALSRATARYFGARRHDQPVAINFVRATEPDAIQASADAALALISGALDAMRGAEIPVRALSPLCLQPVPLEPLSPDRVTP